MNDSEKVTDDTLKSYKRTRKTLELLEDGWRNGEY